jgi:hypothetical protein
MAAAFTKSNGDYLSQRFGRMPSPGELYIAHFLGAKGAEKLFTAGLANPDQIAADLFPKQAKANPAIFYADGQKRTIRQVYRALVSQHIDSGGATPAFTAQQLASQAAASAPLPSRFGPEDMSFLSLFSTDKQGATGSPLEPTAPVTGAAFFTQLYGQ